MKRTLWAGAAVMLLVMSGAAQANIVLSDLIFRDLGSTGFGNAPRLLTLQENDLESGGVIAGINGATSFFYGGIPTVPLTACDNNGGGANGCGVNGGGTRVGANESRVYNVADLGWDTGAHVGIGLDTNESGSNHPLSFTSLTLTLYNSAGTPLASFAGQPSPPGVDISVALLEQQQGNGNSVFDLRLDAAQQAQYDAVLLAAGGAANVFEGLRASFGCGAFDSGATCSTTGNWASTDGAESFLAFVAPGTTSVPEPASMAMLATAIFGMATLALRHRQRM